MAAILAISLYDSHVYMVKLRAFIFGSVMYIYWGYPQVRNYASLDNILKIMNFLKKLHFALLAHLTYMPKILILYLAYTHSYRYIQTNGCIQTHMDTDTDTFFTFCTFWLINDIRHTCQRYKFYIWHTTDIHLHMHRYTYVLSHQNT